MRKNKSSSYIKKSLTVITTLILLFQLLPDNAVLTRAADMLKLSSVSTTLKNGYKVTMSIKNTSNKAVNGWTLKLKKSDFAVTNINHAKAKVSGKSVFITPTAATKKIAANGKISFRLTCKGTYNMNFKYEIKAAKTNSTNESSASASATPTTAPTIAPNATVAPNATATATPTPALTGTTIQADNTAIEIPSFSSLKEITKLPDPFLFKTGSKKGTRVTSKSDWTARRAEISALAQAYEYGVKPAKPETVTGSYSGNEITVTCSNNGKTISFKCKIQYPTTGSAPFPAMIGVNMNTLNVPAILNLGVACITFPADDIAQQTNSGSRGKGKFFDLYGSNYDAGALIAWAWGADCLIDALETTPGANIDPTKLGVTGGSRNGKGALAIGAFDERIALTVPQESGNGGSSGWRTADAMMKDGINVQTLSEIINENCWFAKSLNQFSGKTTKLPYDHDEIFALCAPRGLLVIENPDYVWLGGLSGYATSMAGHMVYDALGVPNNMGYSSIGGHMHCMFPELQQPELTAYIQKFLLRQDVNTKVFRTDKNYTFDKDRWVDWTVPSLQ